MIVDEGNMSSSFDRNLISRHPAFQTAVPIKVNNLLGLVTPFQARPCRPGTGSYQGDLGVY
jgi:hypothetical protein